MSGVAWTDWEKRTVRQREAAGDSPVQILAHLPGRTLSSVYRVRIKLGLARQVKDSLRGFAAFVRVRHAEQWSDVEIAEAWNRGQADPRLHIGRSCVKQRRKAMGLAAWGSTDRYRRRVAEKTREQLAAAGLPSLAALHRKVVQQRIAALGWPPSLRWREAQILSLIWDNGPLTKREICQRLGMRVHPMSRKMLKNNERGGNYLATLMRRGLLVSLPRIVTLGGKGRNVTFYSLPPDIRRAETSTRKVVSHVG